MKKIFIGIGIGALGLFALDKYAGAWIKAEELREKTFSYAEKYWEKEYFDLGCNQNKRTVYQEYEKSVAYSCYDANGPHTEYSRVPVRVPIGEVYNDNSLEEECREALSKLYRARVRDPSLLPPISKYMWQAL